MCALIRFLGALCFLTSCGGSAALATTKARSRVDKRMRMALLIGNNDAGGRATTLRYAQADATKMRDLLVQMSGFSRRHTSLLLGKTAREVTMAFKRLQKQIQAHQKKGKRVLLLLYYSGHVRKENLLLGKTSLSFTRLHRLFRSTGAALRLGVFDACESGALTRIKGLRRQKKGFKVPFLNVATSARGEVILTATGARENAHEDAELRGGIFTHFLASGLRGAADKDKDGFVTLEEAYRYVYTRSLQRTMFSDHGPQRARFLKRLSGQGSFVLASLSKPQSALRLPVGIKGRFFIWSERRDTLLAEFKKRKDHRITIALPPGRYHIRWREGMLLHSASIRLLPHRPFVLVGRGKGKVAWRKMSTKGARPVVDAAGYLRNQLMTSLPTFFGIQIKRGDKPYHFSMFSMPVEEAFKNSPGLKQAQKSRKLSITANILTGIGLAIASAGLIMSLYDITREKQPNEPQNGSLFYGGIGLMIGSIGMTAIAIPFASSSHSHLIGAIESHNAHVKKRSRGEPTATSTRPTTTSLPPRGVTSRLLSIR